MSTVSTSKPQTFTPYVPGTRNAFVQGGNIVRVSWTPDTGTARVYAATELLATREGVESMTLVDAQTLIAEVLVELPVYKHYATHRRTLVSVTPRTPMGIAMGKVEHATFADALADAVREAARHGRTAYVFCDAITIGRTDIARVAPNGEVTYVNDYANPERREISAPETPAPVCVTTTGYGVVTSVSAVAVSVKVDDDTRERPLRYAAGKGHGLSVGDRVTLGSDGYAHGYTPVAPGKLARVEIQPRTGMETYPMRGHSGRKSDVVTSWSRVINGKTFDFSRIVWSEGGTTLRVFVGGKTTQLHTWFTN